MKAHSPARSDRRRFVALLFVGLLALSSVAGLAQGLVSCQAPADRRDTSRPLSEVQARRLADMRLQNLRDGRSGLRATIGPPGRELRIAGWVDWRRPLAYLQGTSAAAPAAAAGGDPLRPGTGRPGRGPVEGLVQAVPGVIATRVGPADA
ncbi:MAG TPA: hypothetical protein VES42_07575, partial [Pilimelia sp.]|nr:hypothetical protein [Pilimelia sp.]